MKNLITTLITAILISIPAFAQPPDTLWTRTYIDGWSAVGSSVEQTTDGGFIICGKTRPLGTTFHDVYLVKTDSVGDTIWTRRFGDNFPDLGNEVHQTMDGGYIIVGSYTPLIFDYDAYMIRTDCDGRALWERTYQFDYDSQAFGVCQTTDGDFVLTGAYTDSSGYLQLIILMTDSNGREIWRYISEDYWYSVGNGIVQCDDGNLVLTGRAATPGQQYDDLLLMKIDLEGNVIWTKMYGGVWYDIGYCIIKTEDSGYAIGGSYGYSPGNSDFYIVKTDSVGDTLWTNTFGYNYEPEFAYGIDQTSDGGYILAGVTLTDAVDGQDCYIVRTDENGEELWSSFIRGDGQDEFKDVQQTSDGGFIVTGTTKVFNPNAHSEVYLVKYDSENNLVEDFGNAQVHDFRLFPPYPNPFNQQTAISFELRDAGFVVLDIFDVTGRSVGIQNFEPLRKWMSAGSHQVVFDADGLSSGVYFARLEVGDFRQTQKILLLK